MFQNHVWEDVTRHNSNLPPLAVKNPECLGLLHKMDKNKDLWVQHYCILKDGCLSLYSGIRATHAHGMDICHVSNADIQQGFCGCSESKIHDGIEGLIFFNGNSNMTTTFPQWMCIYIVSEGYSEISCLFTLFCIILNSSGLLQWLCDFQSRLFYEF